MTKNINNKKFRACLSKMSKTRKRNRNQFIKKLMLKFTTNFTIEIFVSIKLRLM